MFNCYQSSLAHWMNSLIAMIWVFKYYFFLSPSCCLLFWEKSSICQQHEANFYRICVRVQNSMMFVFLQLKSISKTIRRNQFHYHDIFWGYREYWPSLFANNKAKSHDWELNLSKHGKTNIKILFRSVGNTVNSNYLFIHYFLHMGLSFCSFYQIFGMP